MGFELTARSQAYTPEVVERLRHAPSATSLHVTDKGTASCRLGAISGHPGQVLIFETDRLLDHRLIDDVSTWPGFVVALTGDADDAFWQSADQINTFELHGRPWQHLPTVRDEVFDRDKIDVSLNPGRQTPAPMMWLWATARMWFGAGAFALVDRDRLTELPVGRVSLRADGVVAVELFDLDDPIDVVRERQAQFRAWLDFDGIEAAGSAWVDRFSDPCMTIEVGSFPSGGVRRVTEWRAGDRLVPRSTATERYIVELDSAGTIVWSEHAAI